MKDKKYYIIGFSLVALLIAITIGASYAYFTATVNNDGDVNPTVITTGHMELLFSDGQDVSALGLMPGDSVTKTFKVKNIGDVDTVFDIYLSEIINNFAQKEELQYKITGKCASDNNYHQAPANVGNESKIVSSCPIQINEEQEYELEIKFIETNDVQDYNKGKTFSAKIGINEYDYGTMTINVHTDENTSYTIARKIGQELGDLEVPTVEDGYVFAGWTSDATFTTAVSSNTIISSDLSDIYAKVVEAPTLSAYLREVVSDNVVQDDGTSAANMRFVGATPNNYILFGCTDESNPTLDTCELWKIIGVFGSDSHGITNEDESVDLVKVVKAETIGTNAVGYNWSSSSLRTTLDSSKYASTNLTQEVIWETYGGVWDLTGTGAYDYERAGWTQAGKVAIPYLSDFALATDGNNGATSRDTCIASKLSNTTYWKSNTSNQTPGNCNLGSWLVKYVYDNSANAWVLNPRRDTGSHVFNINPKAGYGLLYSDESYDRKNILPTLYLKSNVYCTNCTTQDVGSATNPYIVKLK